MRVLNENGNEAAAKAAKAKVAQFVTESITSKTSTRVQLGGGRGVGVGGIYRV